MSVVPLVAIPLLRPSGRNLIDYLPFDLLLLASGLVVVHRIVGDRLLASGRTLARPALGVALGALVVASTLPYTLRPLIMGPDPTTPIELMEMGEWMRKHLPPQKLIMTTGVETAFYAKTRFIEFPFDYEALVTQARTNDVRYVVLSTHNGPDAVGMDRLLRDVQRHADLVPLHEIKAKGGWARLYHVRDAQRAQATGAPRP